MKILSLLKFFKKFLVFLRILLGTRDEIPVTASAAFFVFVNNKTIALERYAELLCHSMRHASRSLDIRLREVCGRLTSRLMEVSCEDRVAEEMSELRTLLANDHCYSVRKSTEMILKQ